MGGVVVDQNIIFLTILGMLLVTFLPRLLPVWLLASRKLPAPVMVWLRYVPAAVLAAMLFPAIFTNGGAIHLAPTNVAFWAALPTLFVAIRTRSLFYAVLIGMASIALLRLLLPG
jgi:branched-subunit amino acid transport protein